MKKVTITLTEQAVHEIGQLKALMPVKDMKDNEIINHAILMYRANAVGCYQLSCRIENLVLSNEDLKKQLNELKNDKDKENSQRHDLFTLGDASDAPVVADLLTSENATTLENCDNGSRPDNESGSYVGETHKRRRPRRV